MSRGQPMPFWYFRASSTISVTSVGSCAEIRSPAAGSSRANKAYLRIELLVRSRPFIRLLQILRRFLESSLRIIFGPHSERILVDRTIPLPSDIEDLAEVDMRPDFGPLRIQITVESFAEFICSRM